MPRKSVQDSPEPLFDPASFLVYRPQCGCARAKSADLIACESVYMVDSVDRYLRLARTRREALICLHTSSEYDKRKATLAVMPPAVADDAEQLALVVQAVLAKNGDREEGHHIVDGAPTHLYLGDALDEEPLKCAFLAGVTFEDGDQPSEEWWDGATRRWRDQQRIAARPTSIPNRVAKIADEIRAGGVDQRGVARLPVAVNPILVQDVWQFDLCRWEKPEHGVTRGAATVVPVHSGVEFLLVIDLQRVEGRVCEAVALLSHSAGMDLSKLARTLRLWLATSTHRGLPQSAEEVEPAVISAERLRRAFADHRPAAPACASEVDSATRQENTR